MKYEDFLLINLILILLFKNSFMPIYLKEPIEKRKQYGFFLQVLMALSIPTALVELAQSHYISTILMIGFFGVYYLIRKELLNDNKQ